MAHARWRRWSPLLGTFKMGLETHSFASVGLMKNQPNSSSTRQCQRTFGMVSTTRVASLKSMTNSCSSLPSAR